MMKLFEAKLLRGIRDILERELFEFSDTGVSFDEPEIEVWDASVEGYTSEVRVFVRRNGQIDDALEFHVFRDERQLLSEAEALGWFANEIAKIKVDK